jgi:hypothetical protein
MTDPGPLRCANCAQPCWATLRGRCWRCTPAATNGCTGAFTCSAPIHIHGCLADWTGVRCDSPEEHREANAAYMSRGGAPWD